MVTLLGVGFVAGLVTAISPCILPVLPVIFAGASTGGRRRSIAIVVGPRRELRASPPCSASRCSPRCTCPRTCSTTSATRCCCCSPSALIVDPVGRPARAAVREAVARRRASGRAPRAASCSASGSGSCSSRAPGPSSRPSRAVAATHRIGLDRRRAHRGVRARASRSRSSPSRSCSQRLATSWAFVREHARAVRRGSGVVIGVMAVVIPTGAASGLQTDLPGYASSIENSVPAGVETQLAAPHRRARELASRTSRRKDLASALPEPRARRPTSPASPRGSTPRATARSRSRRCGARSCSSTSGPTRASTAAARSRTSRPGTARTTRTGSWSSACTRPSSPSSTSRPTSPPAAASLGVTYPIAIDNDYGTWDAYNNEYWPAEYLIDQNGDVRHTSFGEGDYATTESDIRALLLAGGAKRLPDADRPPEHRAHRGHDPGELPRLPAPRQRREPDLGRRDDALPAAEPAAARRARASAAAGTCTAGRRPRGATRCSQLSYQADRRVPRARRPRHGARRAATASPPATVHVEGYPDLYTLLAATTLDRGRAHAARCRPACAPTTSRSADPGADVARLARAWRRAHSTSVERWPLRHRGDAHMQARIARARAETSGDSNPAA